MNKKERIILILSSVIIVAIVIIILVIGNIVNKSKKEDMSIKYTDDIIEKMNNKENFLIFVTDDVNECEFCPDAEVMVDYYEKNYNLDFFRFDKNKTSETDYKKLLDYCTLEESYTELPFVLVVVDGKWEVQINQLLLESQLRTELLNYNFIEDEYKDIDQSITYDEFIEIYASDKKQLFALYNYSYKSSYNIRDALLEINKEYPINYYVVYGGVSNNAKIAKDLRKSARENGKKFSMSSLVITQNNEVVDILNSMDKNKIMKFLRKYEFID